MSDRSAWKRAFNRINAKHFDYVLCTKDDIAIVAAIELDDKSHQQRKRQERDAFIAGLCNAISLPLIQIPVQRPYSASQVRAQILSAIGVLQTSVSTVAEQSNTISETLPAEEGHDFKANESAGALQFSDAPVCPKCSAPMLRRQAKSGANSGHDFWGCSAFPKCRCIIAINP